MGQLVERERTYLKSQYYAKAKAEFKANKSDFEKSLNLVVIANHIYYTFENFENSLYYSKLLITQHPNKWEGYGLAARDLIALKKFKEAEKQIKKGLVELHGNANLLIIASDVYRSSGNHEKSLEHVNQLIVNHPNLSEGYLRAAEDLVTLNKWRRQ